MKDNVNTRILKSTTIVGGSSALNIFFRIIQSKAVALLLGPQGVGLMGLLNSILGLASTLSGLGIATSGVREIAASVENDDRDELSRTVLVFRRLTLILGFAGGLLVFLLRRWISQVTFGDVEHVGSIGWLSLAVFFLVVSSGQVALIRGMRHIGDLARVSVLGVAIGTLLGIPMMVWWGTQGVVFYILGVAGTTIFVSWWYARQIQLNPVSLSWGKTMQASRGLLKLGLAFMGAGLFATASMYLVKVFVNRQLGVHATGLYEAASALANVYIGFILGAMGADFFPHLASVSRDNEATNRLINAQAQIGTLLALPVILGVMTLGPWLLQLLYSADFKAAFDIFRWQALGTFLRLVSWPLGFLILARAKGNLFVLIELISNLFFLGAAWLGLKLWGVTGVGVAFFALYVFYTGLTMIMAGRLSGFSWTRDSLLLFGWTTTTIVLGFALTFIGSVQMAVGLGLGLTLIVGLFAFNNLRDLIGVDIFNSYVHRLWQRLSWNKS